MASIFHLDLTSLAYPQPLFKTQALLAEGRRGPLTIGLGDEVSAASVSALLEGAGLKTQTYRQGERWLVLGRESASPEILVWHGPAGWQAALEDAGEDEPIIDLLQPAETPAPVPFSVPIPVAAPVAAPEPGRGVVVLAGSQFMGAGDEPLGTKLATAFFDTLAAPGRPPRLLAFYNTGVFLTTRESAIAYALRDLAGRGSTVITSGICLEYFNLRDQLKVGRIGNMYEIIKAQAEADQVIRL